MVINVEYSALIVAIIGAIIALCQLFYQIGKDTNK